MRDQAAGSRVQLSRAKGWRLPPLTAKADRSTILGNPWAPGEPGKLYLPSGRTAQRFIWNAGPSMERSLTAEHVVALHADWLRTGNLYLPASLSPSQVNTCIDTLAETRTTVLELLRTLRGRNIACWCKPGAPCHTETLLELANG